MKRNSFFMQLMSTQMCSIIIGFCFFCLVFSCTTQNKEAKKRELLNEMIENYSNGRIINVDTATYDLKIILAEHSNSGKKKGVIYTVDSDCSFCIGEFIDFIKTYNQAEYDFPVYAIASYGTKENLEYFLEQANVDCSANIRFFFNKQSQFIKVPMDRVNGRILFLNDQNITGVGDYCRLFVETEGYAFSDL